MENAELKVITTRLQLYQEVHELDNKIRHYVQCEASIILENVIKPKMFFGPDQTTVELTAEEFTQIRLSVARLASDRGWELIGDEMVGKYLTEKYEKLRIIEMLA